MLDDFFNRFEFSVMHVGRGDRDVAKRWHLKLVLVGLVPGDGEPAYGGRYSANGNRFRGKQPRQCLAKVSPGVARLPWARDRRIAGTGTRQLIPPLGCQLQSCSNYPEGKPHALIRSP